MPTKDQGWMPVGSSRNWQRFTLVAGWGFAAYVVLFSLMQVVAILVFDEDRFARVVILLASIPVIIAVVVAASFLINPVPRVNLGSGKIRIRRRDIAFSDVTRARTVVRGTSKRQSLVFGFGTGGWANCAVYLRDNRDRPLPDATRELLLAVLRESSVAIEQDRYVKTRIVAKPNLLGQLDKADVIAFVEANPSVRQLSDGWVPQR